jgi:hypothetical protein
VRDGRLAGGRPAGDVGAMTYNSDEGGPIPDVRDRRQ